MSISSGYKVPKLKGTENYTIWSIRAKAYFRLTDYWPKFSKKNEENSKDALSKLIVILEDGPLI